MGVCSYWFEGVLLVSALLTLSSPSLVKHLSYRGPSKEEGRDVSTVQVLIKNFGYFLSMSQQAVSANIIHNSAVGIFSPKTEGIKT